ncbi:hypothetical protein [Clostridium sp.]|uniref:hypothetical protein n=1 Tax=Clostridium sp. TaxID=1506 RepID=UPI0026116366|nr:hypothetical protein [Clostridium sp.]
MNKKKTAGALGIAMIANCIATPSINVFAENINHKESQEINIQDKVEVNKVQNKPNSDLNKNNENKLTNDNKKSDNSKKEVLKSEEITSSSKNPSNLEMKTDKNLNNSKESNNLSSNNKEIKPSVLIASKESKTSEIESLLDKASISINNVWWQHIGTLTFNSKTMKMGFSKSWAETNPYASKNDLLFSVSLINKDGTINKTINIHGGGEHPQNELYNQLNNLSFDYGEKIVIDYKKSSRLAINGLLNNGEIQKSYNVNKRTILNIEKSGLTLFTNEKLSVDPLPIEGVSNKVTSCTVKGITTPESLVTVFLNGKKFTSQSNYVGTFEIPVKDENGIKGSTPIIVCVAGQAPVTVYPTSAPNLGISKASVVTSYNAGLTGENLKFDTSKLSIKISKNGADQFSANLINNEGKPVAKAENTYFNGFSGEKNLNGANFEYGNILSVYQSKKSQINWNNPTVNTGKDSKKLEPENFYYYKITVDGLVPISNNNLKVNKASYDGDSTVDITGKTTPNTFVTVSGGSYSKKVKSDSTGNYLAKIPEEDVNVGDVISIYVNEDNFKQIIYNYSKSYDLGNSKIQVSSQYTQPIFYIGFSPESKKLIAKKNIIYNNYSGSPVSGNSVGTFYTNRFKFSVIDSKTGDYKYSVSTTKLNDSNYFVNNINGKSFVNGDIIELTYNPSLINVGIENGEKSIGNQELGTQYFEVTDKGLLDVNNKFISINPVNILGSGINKTTIQGNVKPNENVNINLDGKNFSGKADSQGKFSVPITNSTNFNKNTKIIVSSEGYIPTRIKLGYESQINLQNSHINFYNNSWALDSIQSSIGFDITNMKFTVQNYMDSFGNGKESYFTLGVYGSDGKTIINPKDIKNGETEEVSKLLNGKSFNYGDIISLSYNSKISIPAIINGNTVLGNVDGKAEYFKITKHGLEKVNFGEKAYTNNLTWSNGELSIKLGLATGNTLSLENGLIEIVDSSNKVVLTGKISKGLALIEEKELDKLKKDESYTFKIKVNNKVIPLCISSNTESYGTYKLFGDSYNNLCIKVEKPKVKINNENDIKSYSEVVNDEISKKITSDEEIVDSLTNEKMMTDIIANAFINRFGLENIQTFYKNNKNNTKFISWLLNNDVAMSEYLQATNISESNINGLQIWSDIWNTYTNSHYGFNLKLAMATALATQTKITDCFNGKPIGSSVERYNIFETLNEEGGMVQGFESLNVKLLEAVVNVPITNPQIREMRALILQNHNNLVSGNHLPTADYTINYNFRNPYNGAIIFGSWADFYGKDETVADVFKIGGVCGSISRIGSIACRVFGQPAHQMGEPGHDAFYSYNIQSGNWSSQYGETVVANASGFDVSNWSKGLALNGNVVTYTDLYAAANNENLVKSNKYLWVASSSIPYDLKLKAINEAIKTQPLNIEAWLFKINLLNNNENVSAKDYIDLSNDIMKSLKDYPEPMFDLLVKFNRNMLQVSTTSQYNDFVKKVKEELNDINKNGNANEKVQANRILTGGYLEKYGFVENQAKILGKININSWNRTSPTDSLTFESNGNIKVDALHTWIGTNERNSGINIKIFSSNMEQLKEVNTSGTEFGTNKIAKSFNNSKFNIGDIIEIIYKPGLASKGYLTLENDLLKTSKVSNTIAVQITKDGLKVLDGKYTSPNGKEYNFHSGFLKDSKGTKYEIFGEAQKGMQFIDNKEYYFNEDGLMEKGLQNIDNNGYYFNNDGVLQTGWQNINGEKYYFSENGKATPGYKTIDGKKYLFANNGLEIQNIIPNSQMKIVSYSTEQNKKEYSANNIIDGKLNDNWQNIWNRSDKNPYVTIELDHPYNLNELLCFPRQDGGWNGDIEEYKILVSMDGKNFKEATSGKWIYSTSNESQYANLNGVKAKYIKIESKKGIYNLATIAEVILSGTDINKTGLEDEITKAKEKLNKVNGYTEESINNLKDAISKGEKALSNKSLTQEQINSLINNIENSIKDLKADKSGLQEALNKAKDIMKNKDQYTESSIKPLNSFITAGESVMNNNKVTPIQVKAATISILSGINGLEANKDGLQSEINKAKDVLKNSDSYTKESVSKLKESLEKAESLMNNKKATPKEVNGCIQGLSQAIKGLKKLPVVVKPKENKNTDKDKNSGNENTGKVVDNTRYKNGENINSKNNSQDSQSNTLEKNDSTSKIPNNTLNSSDSKEGISSSNSVKDKKSNSNEKSNTSSQSVENNKVEKSKNISKTDNKKSTIIKNNEDSGKSGSYNTKSKNNNISSRVVKKDSNNVEGSSEAKTLNNSKKDSSLLNEVENKIKNTFNSDNDKNEKVSQSDNKAKVADKEKDNLNKKDSLNTNSHILKSKGVYGIFGFLVAFVVAIAVFLKFKKKK